MKSLNDKVLDQVYFSVVTLAAAIIYSSRYKDKPPDDAFEATKTAAEEAKMLYGFATE